VLGLSFAAFLVFGIALVSIGAQQDALAGALGLDLAASGLLASALALGLGAGMLSAGPLVDRFPRRPLLLAATLTSGIALLAIDPSIGYARLATQFAIVGWGGGVYDVLLSVVIVERYGAAAARRVSLAHAAATLGAMLAPLLAAWLAPLGWTALFRGTGVAYVVLALAVVRVSLPSPRPRAPSAQDRARSTRLSAHVIPLVVAGFAYLGVETAVTLFAVPYASAGLGLDAARGRASISSFWLGLLVGRVALLAFRGEPDARLLVGAGLFGAVALGGFAALAVPAPELGFGIAGVAIGLVFPLLLTLAAQSSPRAPALATSLVAGGGEAGGVLVPWLHGLLGDAFGARAAVAALALWCVVLSGAALLVTRRRG
jgi:fucose permease